MPRHFWLKVIFLGLYLLATPVPAAEPGITFDTPLSSSDLLQQAPKRVAASYSCSPRKTCSQIRSCAEAQWYLRNCSWGPRLDGDGDGAPCEALCGSNN